MSYRFEFPHLVAERDGPWPDAHLPDVSQDEIVVKVSLRLYLVIDHFSFKILPQVLAQQFLPGFGFHFQGPL